MVAAATKHTGHQALLLTFDQIDFTDEFDGIWACGSLVHVARRDLHSVFSRFSRALKPNGVIYLSFKYGDTEKMEEERFFNDMNGATLGLFLRGHPELKLVHLWISKDLLCERLSERSERAGTAECNFGKPRRSARACSSLACAA
jgi:cyclopropane fatty-acyl-phospholipid synthase-like methyltransferase